MTPTPANSASVAIPNASGPPPALSSERFGVTAGDVNGSCRLVRGPVRSTLDDLAAARVRHPSGTASRVARPPADVCLAVDAAGGRGVRGRLALAQQPAHALHLVESTKASRPSRLYAIGLD